MFICFYKFLHWCVKCVWKVIWTGLDLNLVPLSCKPILLTSGLTCCPRDTQSYFHNHIHSVTQFVMR